jgi:hypothetical protein
MSVLSMREKILEKYPTLDHYELRRVLKWNESGCVTCYSECDCSKPLQLDKSELKLYNTLRTSGIIL